VTYGLFLLIFLCIPIAGLLVALRRHLRRWHWLGLGLVCLIAFVYTTPWDNYAAYKKLWTFAPEFVLGPPYWFGWLPLEEYLFYFAEAILVCLVMVGLSRVRVLVPGGKEEGAKPDALR
jgi:lycopene beta-cyclase